MKFGAGAQGRRFLALLHFRQASAFCAQRPERWNATGQDRGSVWTPCVRSRTQRLPVPTVRGTGATFLPACADQLQLPYMHAGRAPPAGSIVFPKRDSFEFRAAAIGVLGAISFLPQTWRKCMKPPPIRDPARRRSLRQSSSDAEQVNSRSSRNHPDIWRGRLRKLRRHERIRMRHQSDVPLSS